MQEHERWGVHLEYLKVAIALATTLLTVAAAVYFDASKVPADNSRFLLLACAVAVLWTLIYSVLALIALANRLVLFTAGTAGTSPPTLPITQRSGLSFFGLIVTGVLLFAFFAWRTVTGGVAGPQQAIEAGQALVAKQVATANDAVALSTLDTKADKFHLVFKVTPAGKTATVIYDPKTLTVTSLTVQP